MAGVGILPFSAKDPAAQVVGRRSAFLCHGQSGAQLPITGHSAH
jgi:hypothetical protein